MSSRHLPRLLTHRCTALLPLLTVACLSGSDAGDPPEGPASGTEREPASTDIPDAPLVRLLGRGQAVFGIFAGERTREGGLEMAGNRETDFVFYSLESGPFDIPTMATYMEGLRAGAAEAGVSPHPLALRIPPIRDGREAALDHARQGLEAGVAALVYPHVESAEEAALAVTATGDRSWPGNPAGSVVNMILIEDAVGVESAGSIVSTPGVSVVFPGPGDLRRAYEGDAEAIEAAIQTVLAACQEHGVPCGITAGVDDIAERLEQGFQVIIVTDPAALTVGREAVGR